VEEYIRRALPLFEPMEVEYNGGLCEQTWNIAFDLGAFGPFEEMPEILRGREIDWRTLVAVGTVILTLSGTVGALIAKWLPFAAGFPK
jgi:hypothetical protein